jgi:hypothetical protein
MLRLLRWVSVAFCAIAMLHTQAAFGEIESDTNETSDTVKAVRLMSEERGERFRRLLPKVEDAAIQQVLDDPQLILYTQAEMPPAYQDWGGGLRGVHSPQYNISANRSEPFGNGNREFPWSAPAGTHRTTNVDSFRFLWLPRDGEGKLRPIVWLHRPLTGDSRAGYSWLYPVGTIFGEVLMVRSPDEHDYTFELRLRIRDVGGWSVNAFRPFPTAADLAQRIKQLRPAWQDNAELAALVEHLQQPIELETRTLSDRQTARTVFSQSMGIDVLPPVGDDTLVIELLTKTTFQTALHTTWRDGTNGTRTCAPTTDAPFHVVPASFDAGFIEVESTSCMRCHETVNQHVSRFSPGRDWYGRIRGSDGIFSFHPFQPSSISYNGYERTVQMRQELIDASVLARFDAEIHPQEIYHRAKQLED